MGLHIYRGVVCAVYPIVLKVNHVRRSLRCCWTRIPHICIPPSRAKHNKASLIEHINPIFKAYTPDIILAKVSTTYYVKSRPVYGELILISTLTTD